MKRFSISKTLLFSVLGLFGSHYLSAQCPSVVGVTRSHTDVTCNGANDGTITVDLGGSNGTPPFNFELYDNNVGSFVTLSVTKTVGPPNKVVFSNVYPSSYQVVVFRAGCLSIQIAEGPLGTIITEPPAIAASAAITAACTPGTGAINLTVSGGTPNAAAPFYHFTWSGPTAIGDQQNASNLSAGFYNVTITDAALCTFSINNIFLPVLTSANAGPDQSVCGFVTTLAGNAFLAGETGTWTVVSGTGTFVDNHNPTTSVSGLTLGNNVFRWTIIDNGGVCTGTGDDVTITANDPATVNAGPDQSICAGSTVTLAGTIAGSATSATWSGGSGTFAPNATTLNAVYTPSAAERTAGSVTLTLTTNDPAGPCLAVSDAMTITISPVATVNAGPDQTICSTATATLAGVIGGATATATWSGGSGTFAPNATTLNAVYTPGAADLVAGTVTLTLTTNDPAGPCPSVNDVMIITINPAATVNAGPDQTICAGNTVTLAGTFGGSAASVTWTGGAGTFAPNNTTPGAVYTPSAAEVTAGTVTLTLTTNNPAGPCPAVSDAMTMVINANATANAGADQAICMGSTVTLAGTIGGVATVGTWSGGAGTFSPNATTLSAVYTPDAAEIIAGTVTLTLTTDDPAGSCLPASDNMTITINPDAAVFAGPDQNICTGSTVTLGGIIGGSATSATWTGGTGTFNPNPTTLAAIYTPSAAERTAGTVTLTLTTNDPAGPCPAVTDQVTITISSAPTANAGVDQVICAGGTVLMAGTIGGAATTGTWTGGTGTFAPSATTLNATYTPSAGDIAAGTVTLTLTTDDPAGACVAAADQMLITINPAATVSAGPDQNICAGSTATLAGAIGGAATSATWSGGTGTFAPNATTLNAVYTASAAERTAGTVTLTLTTNNPAGPCNAVNDQVTILISPVATANAGPDQTVCAGSTVTLAGAIGGSAGTGTWSGGAGTFAPNATTLNAVYTPSPGEVTAGTLSLTLTTDDPAGSCTAANDIVVITINPVATVNAGVDQSICAGSTVTLAGARGGSATSATWSGGAGTFAPNATTLNAVYTPGAAEVTAGTVTLTLTTNDPAGPCVAVNDQMTITISPAATSSAGPDQSTCAGSTVTLAGAIGGTATTGTWSGGAGTYAPNAITLNAVYTPSAAEISAGTVTLTLTTDDPAGACSAASDNVVITLSPATTVNAGADQSICGGNTATLAGAVGGSATTGTWSGGAGTFSPNATTLNAIYTPTAAEVTAGTVTLTLTTNDPAGPCTSVTDQVVITITGGALVNAGPDQASCGSSPVTLAGSIGGLATIGTWSGGAGSFNPNATTLNAIYTPSAAEVSAGSVTLTLTTDDPAGPCPAGTDAVTITINPTPGNEATFGIETWLGYVFTDAADPAPYPGKVDFSAGKYRGFINETDMATISPFSNYNTVTDAFDINITNNGSGLNIHGPSVCGTYNDNFSIRYRMKKTFAQGVYTFTVGSDDGVRLFLDGVSIIPGAFVNQSYTSYTSASQCITAGQHDLVLEYFENAGFSRLTFDFQLALSPAVTTPVSTCVNSPAPALTASSGDPAVTGFKWYKDAALTTLLFSGASFTPGAADLDVSVVGTTTFFATAVYVCGETPASAVDVNVISSATVTPPPAPAQVCQSAGIIDLTTLVTAVPAGGSFTFTGTGVTVSPNFDPTLVAGTTSITANYNSGTCITSAIFNIDVIATASITVPGAAVAACQTSSPVDLTTLVSATPLGGVFTFTGAGVTGNTFDPSAQSGMVPITVDYNAGGCTDSKIFNFSVTTTASLTITNPTVCPSGNIDLTTLVNAVPAGGVFTFAGGSIFNPAPFAGSVANINVSYVQGGCTAVGTINITVRNVGDPACVGVSNCSVFTVAISNTRPSCSNQNDGSIAINVSGGTPNYTLVLSDGGAFSQTQLGPGAFNFPNLSPANYQITISDAGNTCTLSYSLPVQATVQATAGNFIDANCFNQPVGGATITVSSGGAAPYEYSIDGGTNWISFTSPGNINNLMPNVAPYSILVRDDAADLCPAQVMVTIGNAVLDIDAPLAISAASCANNDGSVQIGTVTGGVSPYTYRLDGTPFATLPAANTFSNLSSGAHVFTVIDANSCNKDFPFNVGFPGQVNFATVAVSPDCAGNGMNGQLVVTIASTGTFQVGISTNPLSPPTVFQSVISAGSGTATFINLTKGTYYVSAQGVGAQCPTVNPATIGAGPDAVDFQYTAYTILCFENKGSVALTGITGSPAVDYTYQIIKLGVIIDQGVITSLQALSTVTLSGLDKGDYQIQLSQDQSAVNGCVAPLKSGFKNFTLDGPSISLDTLYIKKEISLPDIATGSLLVAIKESGLEPYEVRVEPISPTQGSIRDWSAAARNTQSLEMQYSAMNLFSGDYKVSLRDAFGCERDYFISLNVDSRIFIPNIFTPNGDGVNDVFYIRNGEGANVTITNRWGKEVFKSGDYKNDWGGGTIEDGVYYYRVLADGQTFHGWLEIQRGQ